MSDSTPDREVTRDVDSPNPAEVAQNRATGTSADNSDRSQPGDDNKKHGREKQARDVQGGGGGSSGGGGGKKDD